MPTSFWKFFTNGKLFENTVLLDNHSHLGHGEQWETKSFVYTNSNWQKQEYFSLPQSYQSFLWRLQIFVHNYQCFLFWLQKSSLLQKTEFHLGFFCSTPARVQSLAVTSSNVVERSTFHQRIYSTRRFNQPKCSHLRQGHEISIIHSHIVEVSHFTFLT